MSTLHHAVDLEKYHGTGNDFIIVDATDPVPDRSAFAKTHCDRQTGVGSGTDDPTGADGVLFLDLEDRFSPPRIIMTLVQPDGSVAPICGNGARCAAVWAMARTDAEAYDNFGGALALDNYRAWVGTPGDVAPGSDARGTGTVTQYQP